MLDQETLVWLQRFKGEELTDSERRALAFVREVGAITNQDYRQLNGIDTLAASRALVRLRDLGLLDQKGSGNGTYYVLCEKVIGQTIDHVGDDKVNLTPYIDSQSEGLTPYINPLHKGLDAIPKGFLALPQVIKEKILNLTQRCPREKLKEIIKNLCAMGPLQPSQLGKILGRDPQYLRIHFLSKMQKSGDLIYLYPDQPAHPLQAYLVPPFEEEE